MIRFAPRARWVRSVLDGSPFMKSCYREPWLDFAQRLLPHFLTRLGSTSDAPGFASRAAETAPSSHTSTTRARGYVRVGSTLTALAQPVEIRARSASKCVHSCQVRHSTPLRRRGNNTLDRTPDTSTPRKQVRAFVPGPSLNAGALPVTLFPRDGFGSRRRNGFGSHGCNGFGS